MNLLTFPGLRNGQITLEKTSHDLITNGRQSNISLTALSLKGLYKCLNLYCVLLLEIQVHEKNDERFFFWRGQVLSTGFSEEVKILPNGRPNDQRGSVRSRLSVRTLGGVASLRRLAQQHDTNQPTNHNQTWRPHPTWVWLVVWDQRDIVMDCIASFNSFTTDITYHCTVTKHIYHLFSTGSCNTKPYLSFFFTISIGKGEIESSIAVIRE